MESCECASGSGALQFGRGELRGKMQGVEGGPQVFVQTQIEMRLITQAPIGSSCLAAGGRSVCTCRQCRSPADGSREEPSDCICYTSHESQHNEGGGSRAHEQAARQE